MFRRFFVVIFLSMALCLFGGLGLSLLLGVVPPKDVLMENRNSNVLDLAQQALATGGPESLQAIKHLAAGMSPPVQISTSPVAVCSPSPPSDERDVPLEGGCTRISVQHQAISWLVRITPLLFPAAGALIMGLLAAFLLARYFQKPLEILREGLNAFAGGDFEYRIGTTIGRRGDELSDLGRAFDGMGDRLQELRDTVRRLFHDVSHELRSPLARLQATAGVLRQNPSRLSDMLPRVELEIRKLDGLVAEILTLARLEVYDVSELEMQRLDIVDLIQAIALDANFEGQRRGVTCVCEGEDSVVAKVNGELLYRALENIVRNAIRHSADNTVVVVHTRIIPGPELLVSICDHGPGVPANELERIFAPFFKGSNERGVASTVGRAGLGLAIARRAAEAHGGKILARCGNPDGLTVELRIPILS